MRFRTTVELNGKTATGFEVPAEVVEQLGSGKRPSVTVTVGSHTYRSTVASMGGRFMLPLSAENRELAGVTAGDEVEVELALDTAPREAEVPADLAEALEAAPEAKTFFESLSYSRKRRYLLQIEGAKKPETRRRRVADTVAKLADGIG
ncbi:DUF1905 domain-containing protein [Nonomuraea phyllanthi]|uniref:DUF1905 domain-containing protein n=1 Tax=Nonomuraea phyllanthi TaxID=2219224 RepID=A0A5C4W1L5_9ACTN|nr:YdeI/OmpD-associated family protein [Nonomuraea phyllanthi]KAB8191475.1 DUF1905 domain-containing protein [Nonomuraea phyllanthi]